MGKILLANEKIFPVTHSSKGDLLTAPPMTGWRFAGTIQGEGKLAGVPSLFIRLASCNLRCIWNLPDGSISKCDTPDASFHQQGHTWIETEDVTQTILANQGSIQHLVISGGEPMLQKEILAELLKSLKEKTHMHVTIETNGTIFDSAVATHADLVSISPKLSNATPSDAKLNMLQLSPSGIFRTHSSIRYSIDSIQQWIDYARMAGHEFQLKFVVAFEEEASEIKETYLSQLHGWMPSDILLMPLGSSETELAQTVPIAVQMAVKNGWRYSPRIHINLFGTKKGV